MNATILVISHTEQAAEVLCDGLYSQLMQYYDFRGEFLFSDTHCALSDLKNHTVDIIVYDASDMTKDEAGIRLCRMVTRPEAKISFLVLNRMGISEARAEIFKQAGARFIGPNLEEILLELIAAIQEVKPLIIPNPNAFKTRNCFDVPSSFDGILKDFFE